ncbi:hypothetical protein PIB30_057548 [Stylosanthes scabra]|uniref:phospholipase D n=1 Tax=Stylosanthes scabra TaxID=79078 RepID=A0ABU6VJY2_9FABA|nr:hypothetical protein [Stylosanthes scabra]
MMKGSWEEHFYFHCAHIASEIRFIIHDGYHKIEREAPAEYILNNSGQLIKWVQAEQYWSNQTIKMDLKFVDARQHRQGISPEFLGVPRTPFPQRNGCRVTLYQDAHIPDDYVQKIRSAGMESYQPQSCWEDIFDAIDKAQNFIYIAGWSLYTEIALLRDPARRPSEEERGTTLGELLKRKAEKDNVKVVLLLWNDPTEIPGWYGGKMEVHNKETREYFKNTPNVECVVCSRDGLLKGPDGWIYSHHQKIVLVDSDDDDDGIIKRRVVSFIGGFDLSHGRYDTPTHPLFRTQTKDFVQPSIHGFRIEEGGPREPWHDVHAKLEGPIAWDVYSAFFQRCEKEGIKNVSEHILQDVIFGPPSQQEVITNRSRNDTWNAQLFRSIDDRATSGLEHGSGLVGEKNKIIDRSIQHAYIDAIRRAKNFIYIENQYFIGSSFGWSAKDGSIKGEDNDDAWHLVPKELSLKIVSKIKSGERFSVYVVIPMWPEGDPHDGVMGIVQKMLDLQRKTIEMMYKDIVKALKEEKIEQDPRMYLSFFCLGNREAGSDDEHQPLKIPKQNSHHYKAQTNRRFMIYVHSKMMIVDDEYIIIGSANINQRSMDGGRDTEIVMGAYQPNHLVAGPGGARGDIHSFRMSLWYEHLGMFEHTFLNPETEECINKVNELAQQNWDLYSAESFDRDLPGHLLRYPFQISKDGVVQELPEFEFFPDTNASVLGKPKPYIPKRLASR